MKDCRYVAPKEVLVGEWGNVEKGSEPRIDDELDTKISAAAALRPQTFTQNRDRILAAADSMSADEFRRLIDEIQLSNDHMLRERDVGREPGSITIG
jgi:hypothetical protein